MSLATPKVFVWVLNLISVSYVWFNDDFFFQNHSSPYQFSIPVNIMFHKPAVSVQLLNAKNLLSKHSKSTKLVSAQTKLFFDKFIEF